MTEEQAIAIAKQFVAENGLEVGPFEAICFIDGSQYEDPIPPPYWAVYFADTRPEDHPMREEWGEMPTIIMVDDAIGETTLFCYL